MRMTVTQLVRAVSIFLLIRSLFAQQLGPDISISLGLNGSHILSWPATASYVLERTDTLTNPQWALAQEQPTQSGGTNSLTLFGDTRTRFYRLHFNPGDSLPPDPEQIAP